MKESPGDATRGDHDDTAGHELLADLADDFAGRYRRGEHPSIEDYAQQHPALAQQIRELFPAMLMMEQQPALDATLDMAPTAERAGATIGRYKLLERIGEGGFGVVFMAEQTHPIRRKVALKVIKAGMDSRQVMARFEAERQALAMMDHPNIAKVLDAGATDAGRPYFVMELVPGVPITQFCDQNKLAPQERLTLFVQVCQAVQHAHTKGVIHRDLKPTNVLVTVQDDRPVTRVIDFGVAKAAGQHLTDQTLFTQFAQMVGTPLYMSPEQAQMGGIDVDTRSDVYSLGVLLYELLTGTTPFDRQRLGKAALDEVRRIIREEEPPKPSTRLSTAAAAVPSAAPARGEELRRLSGLVRGELDWVVMKAMEKDRARRYQTANDLARDVERYLQDEPVQACPPSARYKLRKFARRHRLTILAVGMMALTLVAGTVVSIWQSMRATHAEHLATASAERATNQATRADQQRQLVESKMKLALSTLDFAYTRAHFVASSDAEAAQRRQELIEKEIALYEELARDNSSITSESLELETSKANLRLGGLYVELGKWDGAAVAYQRAIATLEKMVQKFPAEREPRWELVRGYYGLGESLLNLRRTSDAEPYVRKSLAVTENLVAEAPADEKLNNHLQGTLRLLRSVTDDRPEESVQCTQRRCEFLQKLVAQFPSVISYRVELGEANQDLFAQEKKAGHVQEANRLLHQVVVDWQKLLADFPEAPVNTDANTLNNKAWFLVCQPNLSPNDAMFALMLAGDAAQQLPNASHILNTLGVAYYRSSDYGAAIQTMKKADELSEGRWFGIHAIVIAMAYSQRGESELAHKWYDLAAIRIKKDSADDGALPKLMEEASALLGVRTTLTSEQEEAKADDVKFYTLVLEANPDSSSTHRLRGRAYMLARRWDEAVADYSTVIKLHPQDATIVADRAWVYYQQGAREKAAIDFAKAIELDPTLRTRLITLGFAQLQARQSKSVIESLGKATQLRRNPVAASQMSLGTRSKESWIYQGLGWAYETEARFDEAEAAFREAIALDPNDSGLHHNFADLLRERGKTADAIAQDQEAIRLAAREQDGHYGLGTTYASIGEWKKAQAEFEKATRFTPNEMRCWYRWATLCFYTNDLLNYRQACGGMLDRFAETTNRKTADCTAKACALQPGFAGDAERVMKLANFAMTGSEADNTRTWFEMTQALVDYRAGRFGPAAQMIIGTKPGHQSSGDALAFSILALAQHRLGDTQAAQAALANAQDIIATKMPKLDKGEKFGDSWLDWLQAQIICREAEQLLKESAGSAQKL